MSKNSSYIWSRNLLQSNFNNRPSANVICQNLQIQEQCKQNEEEINCRRKLYKTANNNRRFTTSKDKFRSYNCLPNNKARITASARRNVTRTLHFSTNSLGPRATPTPTEFLSRNNYNGKHQHHNHLRNLHHNLHMNCKCSIKLLNLPNPQRQQYHRHFEKSNNHKSFNTNHKIYTPIASCKTLQHKCLPYVQVIPLNMDKNHHCHHHHGSAISNKLQLYNVKPSVSTQLSKYHHHHHLQHDSQLTWLPQVSQHQEHLLGMFEVLPPLYLLKSTPPTCDMIKPENVTKNPQNHCSLWESIERKSHHHGCADMMGGNSNRFLPLPLRYMEDFKLDYDKILKYLQTKSKPSDRDVIFGNACLLLSKRYGWETSRLEWLLQLEREHQTQRMSNQ